MEVKNGILKVTTRTDRQTLLTHDSSGSPRSGLSLSGHLSASSLFSVSNSSGYAQLQLFDSLNAHFPKGNCLWH